MRAHLNSPNSGAFFIKFAIVSCSCDNVIIPFFVGVSLIQQLLSSLACYR